MYFFTLKYDTTDVISRPEYTGVTFLTKKNISKILDVLFFGQEQKSYLSWLEYKKLTFYKITKTSNKHSAINIWKKKVAQHDIENFLFIVNYQLTISFK